jgi:hypothetical protein
MDEVQLSLARDYPSNVELYPRAPSVLCCTRVPELVTSGGNDEIFGPDGACSCRKSHPSSSCHEAVLKRLDDYFGRHRCTLVGHY